MRAVTRTEYGPPSVLSMADVPTPTPGPDELLVRVRATTVNRTDCGILYGSPPLLRVFTGLFRPRDLIPGTDFAGEVVAVGEQVGSYTVGDRVWGLNDNGLASQAQYLTIAEDAAIARIPDGVDFDVAVASAEGSHYALAFMKRSGYTGGQRVCVYGATGAIGSALVQLVVDSGGDVTAFCPPGQLELVETLGASTVVDYTSNPIAEFQGRFDLVFDAVGKIRYTEAKHLLATGGRFASSELGPRAENLALPGLTRLRPGPKVDFPAPGDPRHTIERMTQLLAEKRFRPLIDRHFPLGEAVAAYEFVLTGQKVGNVILDIA